MRWSVRQSLLIFQTKKKRFGSRALKPMNNFGGDDANPFLSGHPLDPNGSAVDVLKIEGPDL